MAEINDTAVGHSFGLEIDGIVLKGIQEVSGLKMEQDVIDVKENTPDGKYLNFKTAGRPKSGTVTLTRALTNDASFETWLKTSMQGDMTAACKGGAIIIYDVKGEAMKRYKLTAAWVSCLELGALKAGDTTVLTEKVTINYESLEPEGGQ